jgi:hypothetical protein
MASAASRSNLGPMKRAPFLFATCLAALFVAGAADAQAVDRGGRPILGIVAGLTPGQYVWAPELSPEGTALLVVNVATQRAVLFRNGVPIAATTVSTGSEGHETPTGVFTILQKKKEHYSNLYNNAPMPNMQRLTWDGIALHAGRLPGYPASHGCVRLPKEFSALLYDATTLGMTVVITSIPAMPQSSAAPDVAVATEATDQRPLADAPFEWHPERATEGNRFRGCQRGRPARGRASRRGRNRIRSDSGQSPGRGGHGLRAARFGRERQAVAQAELRRFGARHGSGPGRARPV